MTPEREKYLAGISRKERAVRARIADVKKVIAAHKEEISEGNLWILWQGDNNKFHMINLKDSLAVLKKILSMLKKQLPQRWPEKKLKPCPFCGARGNDVRLHVKYDKKIDEEIARVKCFKCALEIGWFHGKDNALKAWNKRRSDE